jgi:hypothetical protein
VDWRRVSAPGDGAGRVGFSDGDWTEG